MAGMKHSELAAKLIVEGCVAHAAGQVRGEMPVAPVSLTELERADIGLAQGGATLFYPLPPTGVFIDMAGTSATVWFTQADSDLALEALDRALKSAYPRTKQLKDSVHSSQKDVRERAYEVDFGNSRLALIEVEYPARGSTKFVARVAGMARKK